MISGAKLSTDILLVVGRWNCQLLFIVPMWVTLPVADDLWGQLYPTRSWTVGINHRVLTAANFNSKLLQLLYQIATIYTPTYQIFSKKISQQLHPNFLVNEPIRKNENCSMSGMAAPNLRDLELEISARTEGIQRYNWV